MFYEFLNDVFFCKLTMRLDYWDGMLQSINLIDMGIWQHVCFSLTRAKAPILNIKHVHAMLLRTPR